MTGFGKQIIKQIKDNKAVIIELLIAVIGSIISFILLLPIAISYVAEGRSEGWIFLIVPIGLFILTLHANYLVTKKEIEEEK